MNRTPVRSDWIAKTLAGLVLGATLALEASAFLVRFGPPLPLPNTAQLAMWITVPVWMSVLSLVYLFRDGLRAWLWLGGAALLFLVPLLAAGHRPA